MVSFCTIAVEYELIGWGPREIGGVIGRRLLKVVMRMDVAYESGDEVGWYS